MFPIMQARQLWRGLIDGIRYSVKYGRRGQRDNRALSERTGITPREVPVYGATGQLERMATVRPISHSPELAERVTRRYTRG